MQFPLIGVIVLALWHDLRTRRVPNWLTGSTLLGGLAWRAIEGAPGLYESVLGIGVAAAIWIPLMAATRLGGGDVKLMIALGAWLGPREAVLVSLATALAGGILAAAVLFRARALTATLTRIARDTVFGGVTRQMPRYEPRTQLTMPYATAIGIGLLVVKLWNSRL